MSEYKTTIGLEIHAELKTNTKMFCSSKNDPDEENPNVNICPVCMAHPGTLPVINKKAVKYVLKVGVALGSKLAEFTEFDRKNYFYPDIPKSYQISQYKYPLVSGGSLNGIELTRIHLEEDTARSSHDKGDYSLVDFNRAGVPLMELVTEPVVESSKQASSFAKEFQLLLRYLGVSDANMDKGEMRVEANISVSKTKNFGTKVEVKNLNSFRAVEGAIEYETKRQIKLLDEGGEVVQETRGWDADKGKTFSQRAKESAHDYRYFPDPDLPKLDISKIEEWSSKELRKEIPELPWERREKFKNEYKLQEKVAEMFVAQRNFGDLFEETVDGSKDDKFIKLTANYISSDLGGMTELGDETGKVTTVSMKELIQMIIDGEVSSRGAKDTLKILYNEGGSSRQIAEENGLLQKSDEGELKKIVEKIITDNESVVSEYKSGKESALQFLIGQGMKETKGSANPKLLKELFEKSIRESK